MSVRICRMTILFGVVCVRTNEYFCVLQTNIVCYVHSFFMLAVIHKLLLDKKQTVMFILKQFFFSLLNWVLLSLKINHLKDVEIWWVSRLTCHSIPNARSILSPPMLTDTHTHASCHCWIANSPNRPTVLDIFI